MILGASHLVLFENNGAEGEPRPDATPGTGSAPSGSSAQSNPTVKPETKQPKATDKSPNASSNKDTQSGAA
ncbi:hypothetical protein N7468_006869 [Penicillium chermesinum]|uniref:Uncharacterized protein n=1 Tax=Penicillium chermesinum TaxID=63820 RepID=A0A9W9NT50_9EURO|nr:uncharacterized protein N7468_006869 [Penicillium chermesinum]KAJ5225644.1 hypothetical protein N7468_006869 [Penicillium chermesinum]